MAPSSTSARRAVVTIFQNRRAVLPYIFVRYVAPRMREWFGGHLDVVLVQHRADAKGGNRRLESLKQGDAGLERVRRFTEEGRYQGAEIVAHEVVHRPYPSIPSFHRGVMAALERQADFHVWLEDDALIVDPECGQWDAKLGPREVGVYSRFHALNCAYMVTRRAYDQRIVDGLSRYHEWTESSRLEVWLRRRMRTSRVHFDRSFATRYHHKTYPYVGLRYVAERVRQLAPNEAHLLDLDFGEGASQLPPVSPEERARHVAEDRKGPMDRLRGLKVGIIEAGYRLRGR